MIAALSNNLIRFQNQSKELVFIFPALLLFWFVKIIIESKNKPQGFLGKINKAEAIARTALAEELNSIEKLLTQVLTSKEVVGIFNTDKVETTISYILQSKNQIRKLCYQLDDEDLYKNVEKHVHNCQIILSQITHVEEAVYKKKADFQQMVIFYNREFHNYTENDSGENAHSFRKEVSREIRVFKDKILHSSAKYDRSRDKMYEALKVSKDINMKLQLIVVGAKSSGIKELAYS